MHHRSEVKDHIREEEGKMQAKGCCASIQEGGLVMKQHFALVGHCA